MKVQKTSQSQELNSLLLNCDVPNDDATPIRLSDLSPLGSLPYLAPPDPIPPFVGRHWVRTVAARAVLREAAKKRRSQPLLFVRHDFGGKTRCLKELGLHLSEGMARRVLYLTFDGAARVQVTFEAATVLQRLLHHIAALASTSGAEYSVAPRAVVEAWLGSTPCILLVDDLHLLLTPATHISEVEELAAFLVTHFLDRANRHIVFTANSRGPMARLEQSKAFKRRKALVLPLPMMTNEYDPDGVEISEFLHYVRYMGGGALGFMSDESD